MLPFNILSELAFNINRNKIKQIDILKDAGNESKRVNKLYNGLLKKRYLSDNDASNDIFGTDESNLQYRKLRIKLFDLLINTSFFTDGNLAKFPEVTKAEFQCYRHFAAANILLSISAQDAAAYLLKRVLEKAIKYEFTSLAAEVSWLLRTKIKNNTDKKELAKYIAINEKYEQKRRSEMEATVAYEELIQFYLSGRATNNNLFNRLGKTYDHLSSLIDQVDTVQFYYLTCNIGVARFMAGNDCQSALALCLKAIDYIEKRASSNSGKLAPFSVNGLVCYTQLKISNTPETEKIIKLCYELSPEFGLNRVKILEKVLHHYLYAGQYIKAIDIYSTAIQHPRFMYLKGGNAEIWKIYAGYFYLLAQLGGIDTSMVKNIVGEVDADLIDYNIIEFKKEKEGMNIPVLMLPVLAGATEGQIEGHVRTKEALVQYAKRYLKKQKNIRSNAMLDFLFAIENYSFQKKATLKTINKTLEIFRQVPIELSEQSSAIEIIPYETLVELICKHRNIPI